ncbi:MAG TPA: 3-carboxy-cis,cis-muconate cycloisomerase [Gaiellaceae bacterium]|nr:3-carboxy-cis,cis-muconate cycloisomerase [Gaiellaceae bacterium]
MAAFEALFVPSGLRAAVSGRAWLEGMLESERALVRAAAAAGLVPAAAAAEIEAASDPARFDFEQLLEGGRAAGNPVEPLVRALAASVGDDASRYVHRGATSQDVLDTAAMLVARRAIRLVLDEADRVVAACAVLAREHRSTPMAARTLLQQAVPTTFGLKAAGWLTGVAEARALLAEMTDERLAAQLGGAAGTLSGFGHDGIRVLELYADELDLAVPALPWHTNRARIAELGGALTVAAGAAAKIALDVLLLAQTEVGEVSAGAGASSTMPQKRNPVGAALARASARLAAMHASVLTDALVHEHERAAGAWHAEWESLSGAVAHTGGALAAIAQTLEGLEVHPERMRANLDLLGGLVLAERVAFRLLDRLGRAEAQAIVREAAAKAGDGASFRGALLADERAGFDAVELDELLDPATALGAAEALVDRALELHAGAVA